MKEIFEKGLLISNNLNNIREYVATALVDVWDSVALEILFDGTINYSARLHVNKDGNYQKLTVTPTLMDEAIHSVTI